MNTQKPVRTDPVCAGPSCQTITFPPRIEAVVTDNRPWYFCSNGCFHAWKAKQTSAPRVMECTEELSRLLCASEELLDIDPSIIRRISHVISRDARPIVVQLECQEEGVFKFLTISSSLSSVLNLIGTDDHNFDIHTRKRRALLPSGSILGICAAAVGQATGGMLVGIDLIKIDRALLVNAPIILTVRIEGEEENPRRTKLSMMAHDHRGGILFHKTIIRMARANAG